MLTKSNRDFLPPIQEDKFLPPIGRWTKFGGLFIVAVVALAIPVASVTKYKETIKTQASVRPKGELRLVQAATEGQITRVAVKDNQTVKQGDVIAAIDDSVPAKSIGKLEKGQTAQMRVSACPYTDYGTLKGKVAAIPPDAVVPQLDNSNTSSINTTATQQSASFYEVAIEPDKTVLGKESDRCAIQLGMEGQADIITKEETVLQFLLRKGRLTTNL